MNELTNECIDSDARYSQRIFKADSRMKHVNSLAASLNDDTKKM